MKFPRAINKASSVGTKNHPWYFAFFIAIVTWLIGMVATFAPAHINIERSLGLYTLFQFTGKRPAPEEIIIITLDRESSRKLGQNRNPSLWDRSLHAEAIYRLSDAGAAAIVFDLLFSQRGDHDCENSLEDKTLYEALLASNNSILYMDLEAHRDPNDHFYIESGILPMRCLADAAKNIAPYLLPKVPSRVDQYWLIKNGAGDRLTLSVMAVILYAKPWLAEFCSQLEHFSSQLGHNHQCIPADNLEQWVFHLRAIIHNTPKLAQAMYRFIQQLPDTQPEKKIFRALLRIAKGPDYAFVNYYGPSLHLSTLPYFQLLQGDPETLPDIAGKIVYIGAIDAISNQYDDFETVFRNNKLGLDISGVEIAATASGNLLDNSEIVPLAMWQTALILLIYATLITIFLLYLPTKWVITFIAFFALMLTSTAWFLFKNHFIWISFIVPLLVQLPVILGFIIVWRFYQANRKQQALYLALRRLLPKEVVQDIIRGRDTTVEGQILEGVCLHTDAHQYTAFAEARPPEEVRLFLNRYYQELFTPVEKHRGFVSDVIGDAMMALWTRSASSPVTSQQMREQACYAALNILKNIKLFNRNNQDTALPTRIGLHYGEIALGNVGASHHYEFRPVGDTVNTASRIENIASQLGCDALISEPTLSGLDNFITRRLGIFAISGKTQSLALYELICTKSQLTQAMQEHIEQFETALKLFENHHLQSAKTTFAALLKAYPADGPAAYYLQLCDERLKLT